jgi:hypothetical protein
MRLTSCLVITCALACSKTDVAPPVTTSEAPAPQSTSPLRPGETLMGELTREASNRPNGKPADDVFAALTKAGVVMDARKQSMGATYKAAYCTGGYTSDGALAVNVCEYTTEADATAGRAYAKTMFPNLKTREVWAHKTTTLTIIQQRTDEGARVVEKRALDAFNAT